MKGGSETAVALHSIAVRLLRSARVADREAGVGPAQLSALSVLYFSDRVPLTVLADAEQVSQPTMSRIVASLAESGLVVRSPDEADKRVQLVAISPAGRTLFEAARARRVVIVERVLRRLTPETRAALAAVLPDLAAAIEQRE